MLVSSNRKKAERVDPHHNLRRSWRDFWGLTLGMKVSPLQSAGNSDWSTERL